MEVLVPSMPTGVPEGMPPGGDGGAGCEWCMRDLNRKQMKAF